MGTMFNKSCMIAAFFSLMVMLKAKAMVTAEGHAAETTQRKSCGIVSSQSETGPGQIAQRAATDKTVVVSDADDGKKVSVPVGGRLSPSLVQPDDGFPVASRHQQPVASQTGWRADLRES
jgi:hypothetical protein